MMNMKDKDVDSGLGTSSSTNFRIRTKLLRTSGAGVNADSSVNLAFARADPLSELVWSPHNGLSLKCANSGADDRKPFLLWNVGPRSAEGLPPLQSIRLQRGGGDDAVVEQGNPTASQTELHADDMIIDKARLHKASENCSESDRKMEDEAGKKDAVREENPQTVQADGVAESRREIADRSKEVSSAVVPATPLKKLESSAENDLRRLTEKDDCGLGGAELPRESALPAEGSCMSSRICLYREKGKGKALSDGDIYGRSSDDEDDSAASSNSAGLSSDGMKGVKRKICDEGVVIGSKRVKKHIHGSDGSTFVTKPDSSFMKWMSNMTKVRLDSSKEESLSPLPLACSDGVHSKKYHENFMCFRPQVPASISMGFQTMFQSLSCRGTDVSNTREKKVADSIEESREHVVDDEKSPEHAILCYKELNPIIVGSPSANVDPFSHLSESNLAKDMASDGAIRADALGEETKITANEAYPDMTLATSAVVERSKPRTSLWITRLSTKTLRPEKEKEIAEKAIGCSTDLDSQANAGFPHVVSLEASFEVKSMRPVLPSQRLGSEAMASVFARRLDAIRHITSSKKGTHSTCFFCGGCHDVRECPSVTKSELKDIMLKLSTFDSRVEGSSCLCIICSRSDHWAVSCPVAPSSRQRMSDEEASFGARHLQIHAGSGRCEGEDQEVAAARRADCSSKKPLILGVFPAYQTWNVHISSSERVPASGETRRGLPLKATKDVEDTQSVPVCGMQNTVVQPEMFDAIRSLRLTRADILRWMNSDVPSSRLNGFFLRLRLGNLEAKSSYYVACITGDVREEKGCTSNSNKSILVDVGGIKSFVSSQYVSNHDFLEDEIKAWWNRTVCSGCRIPSLAELNSKFNDRRTLGF